MQILNECNPTLPTFLVGGLKQSMSPHEAKPALLAGFIFSITLHFKQFLKDYAAETMVNIKHDAL